jgi:hypothetical protein
MQLGMDSTWLLWLVYWLVIVLVSISIIYVAIHSIIIHWQSTPS